MEMERIIMCPGCFADGARMEHTVRIIMDGVLELVVTIEAEEQYDNATGLVCVKSKAEVLLNSLARSNVLNG